MILLLHLMEQLYLHSSTSKTWETSLWLWRKWGFLLLKPLIWNRWVCSFIDKKMMGFWSCKFASNFGVWSTFTKIKFVNEQTIQNGPNPISLFHFLNFREANLQGLWIVFWHLNLITTGNKEEEMDHGNMVGLANPPSLGNSLQEEIQSHSWIPFQGAHQ